MAAARWKNLPTSDAEAAVLADPRAKPVVLSSSEQVINASRAGRAELPPVLGGALGFTAWSWRARQTDPGTAYEYNRQWASRRPWRWHRWAYLSVRPRPKRLKDTKLFWMVVKNIERGNLIKWEQADGGAFYAAPDGGFSYELDGTISTFPRPAT